MTFDFWQILILVLIGLLFFKDTLLKYALVWFGLKDKEGAEEEVDPTQTMLGLMKQLKGHYNDETTMLLTDIRVMADSTRRTAEETKSLLEELKEYGIKCRDKS